MLTLIEVAKPWIVESPAPLTCQALGAVPGREFSQAMTLTTGGPHGPAALAGDVLTAVTNPTTTATIEPMTKPRARIRRASGPITAM
jgi:hypothetical protein